MAGISSLADPEKPVLQGVLMAGFKKRLEGEWERWGSGFAGLLVCEKGGWFVWL